MDVLVSEPMGTLLVNERMIESYLYARDHHLKPGGKMFPVGRLRPQACGCAALKSFLGSARKLVLCESCPTPPVRQGRP